MIAPRATRSRPILEMDRPFTLFINRQVERIHCISEESSDTEQTANGRENGQNSWSIRRMECYYVKAQMSQGGSSIEFSFNGRRSITNEIEIYVIMVPLNGMMGWQPRMMLVLLAHTIVKKGGVCSVLDTASKIDINNLIGLYGSAEKEFIEDEINLSIYNRHVNGGSTDKFIME